MAPSQPRERRRSTANDPRSPRCAPRLSWQDIPRLDGPASFKAWDAAFRDYLTQQGLGGIISGNEPEPFRRTPNDITDEDERDLLYPRDHQAGECRPWGAQLVSDAPTDPETLRTVWQAWRLKERTTRDVLEKTVDWAVIPRPRRRWNAKEMYDGLVKADRDWMQKNLLKDLDNLRLDMNTPGDVRTVMRRHLDAFLSLRRRLQYADCFWDDKQKCDEFLKTLPPDMRDDLRSRLKRDRLKKVTEFAALEQRYLNRAEEERTRRKRARDDMGRAPSRAPNAVTSHAVGDQKAIGIPKNVPAPPAVPPPAVPPRAVPPQAVLPHQVVTPQEARVPQVVPTPQVVRTSKGLVGIFGDTSEPGVKPNVQTHQEPRTVIEVESSSPIKVETNLHPTDRAANDSGGGVGHTTPPTARSAPRSRSPTPLMTLEEAGITIKLEPAEIDEPMPAVSAPATMAPSDYPMAVQKVFFSSTLQTKSSSVLNAIPRARSDWTTDFSNVSDVDTSAIPEDDQITVLTILSRMRYAFDKNPHASRASFFSLYDSNLQTTKGQLNFSRVQTLCTSTYRAWFESNCEPFKLRARKRYQQNWQGGSIKIPPPGGSSATATPTTATTATTLVSPATLAVPNTLPMLPTLTLRTPTTLSMPSKLSAPVATPVTPATPRTPRTPHTLRTAYTPRTPHTPVAPSAPATPVNRAPPTAPTTPGARVAPTTPTKRAAPTTTTTPAKHAKHTTTTPTKRAPATPTAGPTSPPKHLTPPRCAGLPKRPRTPTVSSAWQRSRPVSPLARSAGLPRPSSPNEGFEMRRPSKLPRRR